MTTPRLTREQVRHALEIPSSRLVKQGFAAHVLDALDIGYSRKLKQTVVPLYNDIGNLCIGWTNEKGWLPKGFDKGNFLYGYHLARRSNERLVLVVEGMADVWAAMGDGVSTVATLGCNFTERQMQKLGFLDKDVLIAFNRGETNQDQAERLLQRLRGFRVKAELIHLPDECYRPANMPPFELGKLVKRVEARERLAQIGG